MGFRGTLSLTLVLAATVGLLHCGGEDPDTPSVDRMGRAAINTALIGPFLDPGGGGPRGALQDVYNRSNEPGDWVDLFAEEMASNLAVYDALDANCGNQLLAGPVANSNRYAALAGVLADDRLYLNTDSGVCTQYLAVEANAIGLTNSDCGGRTPNYDTIDITYSVIAVGGLSGVTDGIPSDGDGGQHSLESFPFFAPPLDLP